MNQKRNQDIGAPGNGGQYAAHQHAESTTSSLTVKTRAQRHAELSSAMDFDHPIDIGEGGQVTDSRGIHAPEVYEVNGVLEIHSDDWEALGGFSGQHGYSGPVMHESEYIGGALADEILDNPGTYVAVPVTHLLDDDEDSEDALDYLGWAVLRRKEKEQAPETFDHLNDYELRREIDDEMRRDKDSARATAMIQERDRRNASRSKPREHSTAEWVEMMRDATLY